MRHGIAPPGGKPASSQMPCRQGWDGSVPQDRESGSRIKLVRIVRRQKRILRRARFPLRRSKYANRIYSDHQHVILLALRQHLRKSYRGLCELMEACDSILRELGLARVPHWTTLQKFSARADMRRLERLLLACLDDARLRALDLAVDSTGFSSTSASEYYVSTLRRKRTGKPGRPPSRREVRSYVKQTMAVETRTQLIAAVKFRRGPANDSPDFRRVLSKVAPARQHVRIIVADKGYDCERNHEYAHDVLDAVAVIPVRGADRPGIRISWKHRRRQARDLDKEAYHQRVKIETVHSVEKRRMGDNVLAIGTCQRHKELVFRAFAYNVGRLEVLFLLITEDFY